MNKIRGFIKNNLVGIWQNKDYKFQITINEPNGETYKVNYNPAINVEDENIESEDIRIMYGAEDDISIHFSNCKGSWNLRKITDKDLEVFSINPRSKKVISCIFEKKS